MVCSISCQNTVLMYISGGLLFQLLGQMYFFYGKVDEAAQFYTYIDEQSNFLMENLEYNHYPIDTNNIDAEMEPDKYAKIWMIFLSIAFVELSVYALSCIFLHSFSWLIILLLIVEMLRIGLSTLDLSYYKNICHLIDIDVGIIGKEEREFFYDVEAEIE